MRAPVQVEQAEEEGVRVEEDGLGFVGQQQEDVDLYLFDSS